MTTRKTINTNMFMVMETRFLEKAYVAGRTLHNRTRDALEEALEAALHLPP